MRHMICIWMVTLVNRHFIQDEETVGGQDIIFDDDSVTSNDNPAVKVLSEKSHAEVLKMVDDFRKSEQAIDPNRRKFLN